MAACAAVPAARARQGAPVPHLEFGQRELRYNPVTERWYDARSTRSRPGFHPRARGFHPTVLEDCIVSDEEPVRIVLTPEQREVVKRLSGQHVEAIELSPDEEKNGPDKQGGPLRFRWRLSAATGIPRQAWVEDEEGSGKKKQ